MNLFTEPVFCNLITLQQGAVSVTEGPPGMCFISNRAADQCECERPLFHLTCAVDYPQLSMYCLTTTAPSKIHQGHGLKSGRALYMGL